MVSKINTGLLVLICALLITAVVLILTKRRKSHNTNNSQLKKDTDTFILPRQYNLGPIKTKECRYSNYCNDKVLYPIQGLEVDYGSKMPDDCPCNQFVKSP